MMTLHARTLSLAALLLLCAHADAKGQAARDSAATGLRGLVVTMPGDRPVVGATVTLIEARRSATTNEKGEYEFSGLVPGKHNVSVRKLGFAPLLAELDIVAGKFTEADLELETARPQPLERLTIVEHASDLTGFAERMRTNVGGSFLTSRMFDSVRGKPLIEILADRVPGVRVVHYGRTGQQLLATARGVSSFHLVPKANPTDPSSPTGCFSQIYVDGVRIYAPGTNQPVPELNQFDPRDLQAAEYYPGPATTPVQYSGSYAVCGTLLIWHKAG